MELNKWNYNKVYSCIILEDYIDKIFIKNLIHNRTIITYKKYFALNKFKKLYKYCAVVDSEISFVNTENIFQKLETFSKNKKIIGSQIATNDFRHDLTKSINLSCASFFNKNPEEYAKLKQLTKDFNIYFWFSDIPIYDMD